MVFCCKYLPDNVRKEAEQALNNYKQILVGTDFGFQSEEEFQQAEVGEHMFPISKFDVTDLSKGPNKLADIMYDSNLVEFTVNSNGKTVTRMTMKRNGETYSSNGFGGLGEPLVRGLDKFSTQTQSDVKLVKLGALEFLYLEINGQELLTYISPVSIPGLEQNHVYTADQVIPELQQIASDILEHANEDAGAGIVTNDTTLSTNVLLTNLKAYVFLFALASTLLLAGVVYFYRKKTSNKVIQ